PAAVDSKTPWYNISPDLARYTPQEIGYGYRDGPYAGDGYRKLPEELYEGSVQVGLPRLPQPVFIGYLPPRVRLWRKNARDRSEEHTSELQSRFDLVCRLLLEKKKNKKKNKEIDYSKNETDRER